MTLDPQRYQVAIIKDDSVRHHSTSVEVVFYHYSSMLHDLIQEGDEAEVGVKNRSLVVLKY
jgi:hypothetical protein